MNYCYMHYKRPNPEDFCSKLLATWYELLNHLYNDHQIPLEEAYKAINRRTGVDRRIDGSGENNRRKNYNFALMCGDDNELV